MVDLKKRPLLLTGAAGAALLFAAVATGQVTGAHPVNTPRADDAVQAPAAPGGLMSFAPIVQKVSPAVVSIEITGHASPSEVAMENGGGQDQNPFRFFFGPGGPFQGQDGDDGDAPSPRGRFRSGRGGGDDGRDLPKIHAAGSGFFISGDGYIVTNNHVVERADTISVHTADGQTLKARLVGRDPATDLAVVKVEAANHPYVTFEDSARPRVGDWVVAVGNPFGLGGTATAGIVSALGRENVADSPLVDYMQIDAPINRGNSGGPTFDTQGRVVGVNTAIYSPSGGSVGIGFDIPADVAAKISRQLIATGHVDHGYIGATIQQITPDLADSLGLKVTTGAIVDQLTPGGPAQRAGLRAGDIIQALDGRSVKTPNELTRQVAFSRPGDTLRLTVLRDGHTLELTLHAGVRPTEQALNAQRGGPQGGDDGGG